MSARRYIVVHPTGFVPYCLAEWSDGTPNWVVQRAYAKRFTGPEAHRIVDQINHAYPRPINRAYVEQYVAHK